QRTRAKSRVRPEATRVITREAWSAARFVSAPLARRPRTGRISAAPISGRNVIQVSSEKVVGWSMWLSADVLDDHERDGAAERAVVVPDEDERPGARERRPQARGNRAAVLRVERPGGEPTRPRDQDAADELEQELRRAIGVRERHALLRGQAGEKPMLEQRSM